MLPLSVRGIQLCVALERGAGHWRSRSACRCGFIRMAGAFAGPEPFVPLGPQPGLHVQADDGQAGGRGALYAALTGPATDVPSGVRVVGLGELGEADLWVTFTEPGLARLTITGGDGGPLRGPRCCRWCRFGALAEPPPGLAGRSGPGSSAWPPCCRPGRLARRASTARGVRGRRPGVRGPRGRAWPSSLAAQVGGLATGWAAPGRRA